MPDGSTLVHLSACKGHVDSLQLLLAAGLDTNARDAAGMTPLHAAAAFGRSTVIDLLLRYCSP